MFPVYGRTSPPDSARTTSFCGAIGAISFLEGVLDLAQAKMLCDQGPLLADSRDVKKSGIPNKLFLVVHPKDHRASVGDVLQSVPVQVTLASPMASPFASPAILSPELSPHGRSPGSLPCFHRTAPFSLPDQTTRPPDHPLFLETMRAR